MSFDDPLSSGPEPSAEGLPWLAIIAGVIIFGLLVGWILHEKTADTSRQATAAALEKELDGEQAALQSQKDKVIQLSQQLEVLKSQIEAGQLKDRKKAVENYNQLAAEQRAERDKWITMANQYNEKVAQ